MKTLAWLPLLLWCVSVRCDSCINVTHYELTESSEIRPCEPRHTCYTSRCLPDPPECSREYGAFQFENECDRFYICVKGKSYVIFCQEKYHFLSTLFGQGHCVPGLCISNQSSTVANPTSQTSHVGVTELTSTQTSTSHVGVTELASSTAQASTSTVQYFSTVTSEGYISSTVKFESSTSGVENNTKDSNEVEETSSADNSSEENSKETEKSDSTPMPEASTASKEKSKENESLEDDSVASENSNENKGESTIKTLVTVFGNSDSNEQSSEGNTAESNSQSSSTTVDLITTESSEQSGESSDCKHEGKFPVKDDCTKFVLCVREDSNEELTKIDGSCPFNLLFDPVSRSCRRKVNCGSRR